MKIPPKLLAGPWMTDHESSVVAEMMKNGWDNYDYVVSFESRFADWHGRKYALNLDAKFQLQKVTIR